MTIDRFCDLQGRETPGFLVRNRKGKALAIGAFTGDSSYQNLADMTQPYQVRTGCGHIVTRRMRPATAGVPYTPETVIDAPNGRPCDACEQAAREASIMCPMCHGQDAYCTLCNGKLAVTRSQADEFMRQNPGAL